MSDNEIIAEDSDRRDDDDPNWMQRAKEYERKHGYGIAGPLPIAPWPYD